jgi:hypothetical protein
MKERPWLSSYDPGLPHTLAPYPDGTLLDVLAETVRQRPGARVICAVRAGVAIAEEVVAVLTGREPRWRVLAID